MERQTTFADIQSMGRRRATKRDLFLREMDQAIPRAALVDIVKPHYYPGKRGRRPVGIERMLRMYFLQLWFNLSDEGVEDAVYDSRAFSEFMGATFGAGDQVPDATTLLKFRRIIESKGLAAEILSCASSMLEAKGVMMRGGSIADATFIEAPSSTKNAEKSRDPEARSSKKGNVWRFGYKAHAGVDAGSGLVHTAEVAAAIQFTTWPRRRSSCAMTTSSATATRATWGSKSAGRLPPTNTCPRWNGRSPCAPARSRRSARRTTGSAASSRARRACAARPSTRSSS